MNNKGAWDSRRHWEQGKGDEKELESSGLSEAGQEPREPEPARWVRLGCTWKGRRLPQQVEVPGGGEGSLSGNSA